MLHKKSKGLCYDYSRGIALFLKDAKLMCCSIETKDGPGRHAVIVKDNCVYDTNIREHYNYDEYITLFKVNIYKIFPDTEYRKESFFEDIQQGFVEWCAKNKLLTN